MLSYSVFGAKLTPLTIHLIVVDFNIKLFQYTLLLPIMIYSTMWSKLVKIWSTTSPSNMCSKAWFLSEDNSTNRTLEWLLPLMNCYNRFFQSIMDGFFHLRGSLDRLEFHSKLELNVGFRISLGLGWLLSLMNF